MASTPYLHVSVVFFFFFLVLSSVSIHALLITTEEHAQQAKTTLLAKAQLMTTWTATNMHHLHPETKQFKLRKNRGITDAEVTFMQRMVRRLQNTTISDIYNLHFYKQGQSCSVEQKQKQTAIIIRHISMGICSEESAYKLCHMGFPQAKTFIDIGANKGYITALIAGLWEGYSSGLTPYLLFQKYEALQVFQKAPSPAGFCRTGLDRAFPLHCPMLLSSGADSSTASVHNRNRHADGQCDRQRNDDSLSSPISIYAVDGSSSVANTLRDTLQQMSPLNTSKLGANIRIFHLAMNNREGSVLFSKKQENAASGYEGGSIVGRRRRQLATKTGQHSHSHSHGHIKSKKYSTALLHHETTERVEMTTLNSFTALHQIQTEVDFIKIDAEGHDLDVIQGANQTLLSVGVIFWEQSSTSRQLLTTLKHLERLHFECYIPAIEGFLKLTSGCFDMSRVPKGNNIVCASRIRAPGAVLAYDVLSFFHDDE